ncbi:MAG TPA: cation:dicarboxylase symporter family transporter, partial [Aquificales bacterium]|nr:cation:dicarboxylase symporter family transporter [Aquificales bacterium]
MVAGFLKGLLDWRKVENQTLYAVILAVLLGVVLPNFAQPLKVVGDIFLRLLKSIAIPLVMASIFVSIASLRGMEELKELGIKALVYYTATTFLAVLTGLVVVNLFFGIGETNITPPSAGHFEPKQVSPSD